MAFFLTVGDLLPGDLVCVSPSFSTAWGIHRITEAGGSSGVSAPSLTVWTSAPSLLWSRTVLTVSKDGDFPALWAVFQGLTTLTGFFSNI